MRVLPIGATVAVAVLVALLLFGGSDAYTVKGRFQNAGQLVKGNPVQTGGTSIGSVDDIKITDDGQADVTLKINDDYAPLPKGTRAAIRQLSLSGLANRFVEMKFPPGRPDDIPDGGTIGSDHTTTAVDLDELFNTLDPKTRKALQGFFKGQARQFAGRGRQANVGWRYLNPSLATTSRLFNELTRDTPVLERFLVDSEKLVTAVAERRDDLAGLIGNLNETTRALGNQKAALAESVGRLPPFMRRTNTTFVNLRAALDDADPLVDASKPVARRLGPFLKQARGFAADAEPTIRDLSRTIRRRGRKNDLTDLLNSVPALADIAVETKRRTVAPGGRTFDVGETRGAFPETADAFRAGAPEIGFARPYTVDFLGWLDDFSNTGIGYDGLGEIARAQVSFAEVFAPILDGGPNPTPLQPGPVKRNQFRRCPGAAEAPAADGSNVLSEQEQAELNCTEGDRAVRNP